LWADAASSRAQGFCVWNPLQGETDKSMVKEPLGNSAEGGDAVRSKESEEISSGDGFYAPIFEELLSVLQPLFEPVFGPLLRSVKKLFLWISAGKAQISIGVGVFAGLMVALGFILFDFQKEEWMLKLKYPEALSSYERNVLYARDLINQQKYPRAESILRDLVETRRGTDNHADALLLLAACLEKSDSEPNTREQARLNYEIFIAEYPTDARVPSAYMMLAENFAADEMYEDSNARYHRLLRILPEGDTRAEVEFRIAQNYYKAGRLQAAETAFEQIGQKYAGSPVGWDSMLMLAEMLGKSGKYQQADKILSRLILEAASSAHAAAALGMLAKNALNTGDHVRAIELCRRWLDESSSMHRQADIMLVLGRAHLEKGEPAQALNVATELTERFPDFPRLAEALILHGAALEALGKLDEAESTYLKAIKAFPSDPSPRRSLARLYTSAGRLSAAIGHMEQASRVAPDDDSLLLELAKLYRSNGENEKALGVLETFSRERQLSRNIEEAFLMLVDMYRQLDRPYDAYRTLNRRLSVALTSTDEAAIYEDRGDILADVGLFDDAVEDYRKALEAGANIGDMKIKIAGSLLAAERPDDCVDELELIDYASLPADDTQALMALKARALIALEMLDPARRAIQEAMALHKGEEKITLLALLMHVSLKVQDEQAASKAVDMASKLIEAYEGELPHDAQQLILDWAEYLYEKGEYARAAMTYSRIRESAFSAGTVAWALYQQGNCYFHLGDYPRAGEAYSRLVSEYSYSEWAKFALQKDELMSLTVGT
jgi:tetratricopeptide (TPR) repeat protein